MMTAKVFKNGRSQAIRLPKEFRVKGPEVYLKKVPEGFIVMQQDPWKVCLDACQALSKDFMARRIQPPQQQRDWKRE